MNLLRSYRIARARREYQPPEGATHVLEWVPPWALSPEPESGDGLWCLEELGDWLAGTPNSKYTSIEGPASMTEEDFGQFSLGSLAGVVYLDEAGYLGRSETEITCDGRTEAVPVWWLEVAS